VLVRGALHGAKWDALRASWSRANIAASHPDITLKVSSIPHAKAFGVVEQETYLSLSEYVGRLTMHFVTALLPSQLELV
jgi:hypothetical protein